METNYQDALEQIRAMFTDFDEDTIKTVLVANDGHVERTIEDLLKMTAEADNKKNHDQDDDNLFADPVPNKRPNRNEDLFGIDDEPQGNRLEDLGIFQKENGGNFQDEKYARDMQEKEDAAIAYRLQKEYLKQEQEVERQVRSQQQQHRNRQPQAQPQSQNNNRLEYDGPQWDFSQNAQPSNPSSNRNQPSNQVRQDNGMPANQGSGSKKKGFLGKVKAGFSNLFGKKGKKQAPAGTTGAYAEIDNLEEHEVYNFSNADPQARNAGLHQLNNNNNNVDEPLDDAPMQLADVLDNRGGHESDEENNHHYNNNNNNHDNFNQNRNNQGQVSNDHFGF